MYTYDEIVASAYFVFKEKLSKEIIMTFIAIRKNSFGEKFNHNLKLKELKNIIEFDNPYYKLKDDKKISDLMPYIKIELIVLFQAIEESLEKQSEQPKIKKL